MSPFHRLLGAVLAAALCVPAPALAQAALERPTAVSAEPDAAPVALTPSEMDELKKRVRQRCGVTGEAPEAFLPWYYHYVLGRELHRAGDEAGALECLQSAVFRRPEPKAGARVYGLWFVDYFPYSLLADVNDRLGRPDCAADARKLAETLESPKKR